MDDSENYKRLTLEWTKAQPSVARFIHSFIRNPSDAEDVLQEVALVIVDSVGRYDPDRPFIGWALGIARNVTKAYLRKKLKQLPGTTDESAVDRVAEAFEGFHPHLEDRKQALADCIRKVPTKGQQLLSQHYEKGLKPAEIAAQEGKGANHIAVMLHRLRASLRKCVEFKMEAFAQEVR